MSNLVLTVDTERKTLNPCTPGVARGLLKAGKAAVLRWFPFTIILHKVVKADPQPMQLKLDPGAQTTGVALMQGEKVVFAAELQHRGEQIKAALLFRHQLRRSRRSRKTRYRPARFLNRTRPPGWLPPSLQHRVDTTMTWVNRLCKVAPITELVQELVRFDLQQLEHPEISGVEYQQGTLQGYEVREYLLEKWQRQCAYCNAKHVPLQVEHIHPKFKGGSDRIANLCLACETCNQKKGTQAIEQFLKHKPDVLKRVLAQTKRPLKDGAAVNSTRWTLFQRLQATGLTVKTGSGGQTKFNRTRLELPKTHWLDAACVGQVDTLTVLTQKPLLITAKGHGKRQMCRTDKYGFPQRFVPRLKFIHGFQTGDIVKAIVTKGTKSGTYVGRVAVRSTGSFNLTTAQGLVQGISYKYCSVVHSKDGYNYT